MKKACLAAFAVIVLAAPAGALDLPTRKAGLWDMKMLREGATTAMPAMQQCTDASTDKDMTTMFGSM